MVNVDRIKALAKTKGFKLGYLCELVGEDQNYLNKVKLGLRRMDDNRVFFLAEKLNTTYEYLTGQTDDPNPVRRRKFDYDRYEERRKSRGILTNYVERMIDIPPIR